MDCHRKVCGHHCWLVQQCKRVTVTPIKNSSRDRAPVSDGRCCTSLADCLPWKFLVRLRKWAGVRSVPFIYLSLLSALIPGCVTRRLTVRSTPPGALVSIDDHQIGTAPVAVNYLHYGTRKIRLEKDGYETLTVYEQMRAPWYDIFPVDFVTENFVPGELLDRREFIYQLQPQRRVPRQELTARADELRNLVGGSVSSPGAPATGPFSPQAEPLPIETPGALLPPVTN